MFPPGDPGGPCNISGSILQTALYEDYHVEHSIVHVIVIFCHCNVHPSCVLCALVIGTRCWVIVGKMGVVAEWKYQANTSRKVLKKHKVHGGLPRRNMKGSLRRTLTGTHGLCHHHSFAKTESCNFSRHWKITRKNWEDPSYLCVFLASITWMAEFASNHLIYCFFPVLPLSSCELWCLPGACYNFRNLNYFSRFVKLLLARNTSGKER